MKIIITAEIDDDEIGGMHPAVITGTLASELDGFEFYPPGTESLALFGVKVALSDHTEPTS